MMSLSTSADVISTPPPPPLPTFTATFVGKVSPALTPSSFTPPAQSIQLPISSPSQVRNTAATTEEGNRDANERLVTSSAMEKRTPRRMTSSPLSPPPPCVATARLSSSQQSHTSSSASAGAGVYDAARSSQSASREDDAATTGRPARSATRSPGRTTPVASTTITNTGAATAVSSAKALGEEEDVIVARTTRGRLVSFIDDPNSLPNGLGTGNGTKSGLTPRDRDTRNGTTRSNPHGRLSLSTTSSLSGPTAASTGSETARSRSVQNTRNAATTGAGATTALSASGTTTGLSVPTTPASPALGSVTAMIASGTSAAHTGARVSAHAHLYAQPREDVFSTALNSSNNAATAAANAAALAAARRKAKVVSRTMGALRRRDRFSGVPGTSGSGGGNHPSSASSAVTAKPINLASLVDVAAFSLRSTRGGQGSSLSSSGRPVAQSPMEQAATASSSASSVATPRPPPPPMAATPAIEAFLRGMQHCLARQEAVLLRVEDRIEQLNDIEEETNDVAAEAAVTSSAEKPSSLERGDTNTAAAASTHDARRKCDLGPVPPPHHHYHDLHGTRETSTASSLTTAETASMRYSVNTPTDGTPPLRPSVESPQGDQSSPISPLPQLAHVLETQAESDISELEGVVLTSPETPESASIVLMQPSLQRLSLTPNTDASFHAQEQQQDQRTRVRPLLSSPAYVRLDSVIASSRGRAARGEGVKATLSTTTAPTTTSSTSDPATPPSPLRLQSTQRSGAMDAATPPAKPATPSPAAGTVASSTAARSAYTPPGYHPHQCHHTYGGGELTSIRAVATTTRRSTAVQWSGGDGLEDDTAMMNGGSSGGDRTPMRMGSTGTGGRRTASSTSTSCSPNPTGSLRRSQSGSAGAAEALTLWSEFPPVHGTSPHMPGGTNTIVTASAAPNLNASSGSHTHHHHPSNNVTMSGMAVSNNSLSMRLGGSSVPSFMASVDSVTLSPLSRPMSIYGESPRAHSVLSASTPALYTHGGGGSSGHLHFHLSPAAITNGGVHGNNSSSPGAASAVGASSGDLISPPPPPPPPTLAGTTFVTPQLQRRGSGSRIQFLRPGQHNSLVFNMISPPGSTSNLACEELRSITSPLNEAAAGAAVSSPAADARDAEQRFAHPPQLQTSVFSASASTSSTPADRGTAVPSSPGTNTNVTSAAVAATGRPASRAAFDLLSPVSASSSSPMSTSTLGSHRASGSVGRDVAWTGTMGAADPQKVSHAGSQRATTAPAASAKTTVEGQAAGSYRYSPSPLSGASSEEEEMEEEAERISQRARIEENLNASAADAASSALQRTAEGPRIVRVETASFAEMGTCRQLTLSPSRSAERAEKSEPRDEVPTSTVRGEEEEDEVDREEIARHTSPVESSEMESDRTFSNPFALPPPPSSLSELLQHSHRRRGGRGEGPPVRTMRRPPIAPARPGAEDATLLPLPFADDATGDAASLTVGLPAVQMGQWLSFEQQHEQQHLPACWRGSEVVVVDHAEEGHREEEEEEEARLRILEEDLMLSWSRRHHHHRGDEEKEDKETDGIAATGEVGAVGVEEEPARTSHYHHHHHRHHEHNAASTERVSAAGPSRSTEESFSDTDETEEGEVHRSADPHAALTADMEWDEDAETEAAYQERLAQYGRMVLQQRRRSLHARRYRSSTSASSTPTTTPTATNSAGGSTAPHRSSSPTISVTGRRTHPSIQQAGAGCEPITDAALHVAAAVAAEVHSPPALHYDSVPDRLTTVLTGEGGDIGEVRSGQRTLTLSRRSQRRRHPSKVSLATGYGDVGDVDGVEGEPGFPGESSASTTGPSAISEIRGTTSASASAGEAAEWLRLQARFNELVTIHHRTRSGEEGEGQLSNEASAVLGATSAAVAAAMAGVGDEGDMGQGRNTRGRSRSRRATAIQERQNAAEAASAAIDRRRIPPSIPVLGASERAVRSLSPSAATPVHSDGRDVTSPPLLTPDVVSPSNEGTSIAPGDVTQTPRDSQLPSISSVTTGDRMHESTSNAARSLPHVDVEGVGATNTPADEAMMHTPLFEQLAERRREASLTGEEATGELRTTPSRAPVPPLSLRKLQKQVQGERRHDSRERQPSQPAALVLEAPDPTPEESTARAATAHEAVDAHPLPAKKTASLGQELPAPTSQTAEGTTSIVTTTTSAASSLMVTSTILATAETALTRPLTPHTTSTAGGLEEEEAEPVEEGEVEDEQEMENESNARSEEDEEHEVAVYTPKLARTPRLRFTHTPRGTAAPNALGKPRRVVILHSTSTLNPAGGAAHSTATSPTMAGGTGAGGARAGGDEDGAHPTTPMKLSVYRKRPAHDAAHRHLANAPPPATAAGATGLTTDKVAKKKKKKSPTIWDAARPRGRATTPIFRSIATTATPVSRRRSDTAITPSNMTRRASAPSPLKSASPAAAAVPASDGGEAVEPLSARSRASSNPSRAVPLPVAALGAEGTAGTSAAARADRKVYKSVPNANTNTATVTGEKKQGSVPAPATAEWEDPHLRPSLSQRPSNTGDGNQRRVIEPAPTVDAANANNNAAAAAASESRALLRRLAQHKDRTRAMEMQLAQGSGHFSSTASILPPTTAAAVLAPTTAAAEAPHSCTPIRFSKPALTAALDDVSSSTPQRSYIPLPENTTSTAAAVAPEGEEGEDICEVTDHSTATTALSARRYARSVSSADSIASVHDDVGVDRHHATVQKEDQSPTKAARSLIAFAEELLYSRESGVPQHTTIANTVTAAVSATTPPAAASGARSTAAAVTAGGGGSGRYTGSSSPTAKVAKPPTTRRRRREVVPRVSTKVGTGLSNPNSANGSNTGLSAGATSATTAAAPAAEAASGTSPRYSNGDVVRLNTEGRSPRPVSMAERPQRGSTEEGSAPPAAEKRASLTRSGRPGKRLVE